MGNKVNVTHEVGLVDLCPSMVFNHFLFNFLRGKVGKEGGGALHMMEQQSTDRKSKPLLESARTLVALIP